MNWQIDLAIKSQATNPRDYSQRIFDSLDVSETTRIDYKYRIGLFLEFIKNQPLHRNTFLEYKRFLAKRNDYSVSTKNKYLATARIFLKELNRIGLLPVDITQNIKSFAQTKKHRLNGLNEQEISQLSEWIHQLPPTPRNTRLKAILCLLTFQGLRQIEIGRATVSDVDLVHHTISIYGKGRDDKETIDLHPETVKALSAYLKINRIADGPLFVCQSNHNINQRLTTRGLRQIVKTALRELGIDKTVHGFRHYFTTKLIKSYKGDLLAVAEYTRHRNIETLQVYNDNIRRQADLPRYYETFQEIHF